MIEAAIFMSMALGSIMLFWVLLVRTPRSHGGRTLRLAVFAHIAGAVIWLPMLAMVAIIESFGSEGMAGWTWRRGFAAVWFWLMMSFVMAAGLVENAKRGRRGLFGFVGRDVL